MQTDYNFSIISKSLNDGNWEKMDDYAENCLDYNIYSNAMYNNHALERKRTENKVISGANVTYQHCENL